MALAAMLFSTSTISAAAIAGPSRLYRGFREWPESLRVFGRLPVSDVRACTEAGVRNASRGGNRGGVRTDAGVDLWGICRHCSIGFAAAWAIYGRANVQAAAAPKEARRTDRRLITVMAAFLPYSRPTPRPARSFWCSAPL